MARCTDRKAILRRLKADAGKRLAAESRDAAAVDVAPAAAGTYSNIRLFQYGDMGTQFHELKRRMGGPSQARSLMYALLLLLLTSIGTPLTMLCLLWLYLLWLYLRWLSSLWLSYSLWLSLPWQVL